MRLVIGQEVPLEEIRAGDVVREGFQDWACVGTSRDPEYVYVELERPLRPWRKATMTIIKQPWAKAGRVSPMRG